MGDIQRSLQTLAQNSTRGLRDLDREFSILEAEAQAFGNSLDVVSSKKQILKQKILELIAQGLKPEDAQVQQLRASYDALGREEDELRGKNGNLANDTAMLTTLYGHLANAAKVVVGALAGLAVNSVTMAAGFETAQVSWGVLLGDMKAGKPMMDSIKKWATETPYAFDAANKAATTLKGFGVEGKDLIPIMSQLGDVAHGNGDKLTNLALVFGQVKAQGKAMTQDLYQFINAGVPIFDLLSKAMGVTTDQIKDLAASGSIRFEDISKAMELATSKGGLFYDMMGRTSKTVAGQWSTALDNVNQALADLASKSLPAVGAVLTTVNKSFEGEGAKVWTAALGIAVPIVVSATLALGALATSAFLASGAFATLTRTIQAGATALRANPLGIVLTAIAIAIPPIIALVSSLGSGTEDAGKQFEGATKSARNFQDQLKALKTEQTLTANESETLRWKIKELSRQGESGAINLGDPKIVESWFNRITSGTKVTAEQLARLALGSEEAGAKLKSAAANFLGVKEVDAANAALVKALEVQDQLQSKGYITEKDAIEAKLKLRQKEIDKILETAAKAGTLTAAEAKSLDANKQALAGYQARLQAIKENEEAAKNAEKTQTEIDQEFEDRQQALREAEAQSDAEFRDNQRTAEEIKISNLLALYEEYGVERIDLETLTVDELVALNEYMAAKGEKAFGSLMDQLKEKGKKTTKDLAKNAADWSDVLEEIDKGISSVVKGGLMAIGGALVEGNASWEKWGQAALGALSQVLQATGAQLAAMAAVELGKQNWALAAALGGASAAAFVAAGAFGAMASKLGGVSGAASNAKDSVESLNASISTTINRIQQLVKDSNLPGRTTPSQLLLDWNEAWKAFSGHDLTLDDLATERFKAWAASFDMYEKYIKDASNSLEQDLTDLRFQIELFEKIYTSAADKAAYHNLLLNSNLQSMAQDTLDFWSSLQSMGTDVSKNLVEALTSGWSSDDFLKSIRTLITDALLKASVFTEENSHKIAEIGAKIAEGIAAGFSEDQLLDLQKELEALFASTSASATAATDIIDQVFGDLGGSADATSEALAKVKSQMTDFFDSLSGVGADISQKLIDNLVNGLSGDDFLYAMEEYITQAVVRAAVYTQSFASEVAAIGDEIKAGIESGFTGDQLAALKDRLAALYENAATAADAATSIVQSAFASYKVGTLDVKGDQPAFLHDSEIVLSPGIASEARASGIYIGPPEGLAPGLAGQFSSPFNVSMVATGIMMVDGKVLGQVAFEHFDSIVRDAYGV